MKASHTGILPNFPQISMSNKIAQICPSNNNISLVSISKLYDDNYELRINKKVCTIYKENKIILTVLHYSNTGIYILNLHNPI